MIGVSLPIGCVRPPTVQVRCDRYRIEAEVRPDAHWLRARATLDLVRSAASAEPQDSTGGNAGVGQPGAPVVEDVAVELVLHPGLRVRRVRASGGRVTGVSFQRSPPAADTHGIVPDRLAANVHRIQLTRAASAFALTVEYEGAIAQDVEAGERAGEIHNFQMQADIRPEGVYLTPDAHWYPSPLEAPDAPAHLSDFTLLVAPVEGFPFVAGAQSDRNLEESTGLRAWRSPFPLPGLVLVGGPHEVHTATHGSVTLRAHLKPGQSRHAAGLLDATKRNLQRYEPLIGPYPACEYSIVDNYFSSGFAFPTFTLLSSAVIDMGERSQTTHGYLDHEFLHSWWGNGILVDPRDGNWCESLTSYASNYYGFVLDGNLEEARRKRRNYSHFLSRIKTEEDKPLGTFDRPGGCNRNLAYNKGAMVFHMLATQMGQDPFWSAMRRFRREFIGRYASWDDLRRVCEFEGGRPLDAFFSQWVRRGGAPMLSIESAVWRSDENALRVQLAPGAEGWSLDLPIRVAIGDRARDLLVPLSSSRELRIPLDVRPTGVELDPDYQLFRKIPVDEIVPTTASTRTGHALTCVLPEGDVPAGYSGIQSVFESGFAANERLAVAVSPGSAGAQRVELAERTVLILGTAVHNAFVSAFLSAIEFPITWEDEAFEHAGVAYDDPAHAVLCTVRHPNVPGGGVTVVYANSMEAIPRAANVPMYEHSLVIFESGRPIHREDFERHRVVPVQ